MKNLLPYALALGLPFFALGQPIRTTLLQPAGSIRITNDSLLQNYTNITLDWQLLVDGITKQKGSLPALLLTPGHSRTVRLPLHLPTGYEEAYLSVQYRRLKKSLAAQQLLIKTWGGDTFIPAAGELSFTDSNDVFTVTSPVLHLHFDKQTGWMQQYEANHLLLVADTNGLRPALANPPHLQLFSTSTGSQMVIVRAEYTLPDISCLLHLSYTINAAGAMLVEQTMETDTTRQDSTAHQIDRFGMDWILPPGPDSIAWYGLTADNQDTIPSIHYEHPFPASGQGPHTIPPTVMTRWWAIVGSDGKGFQLTADSNFLRLYSTGAQLHIDASPFPRPSPGLHYHQAFKVTPITPAPPPATPTIHPTPTIRPAATHPTAAHPAAPKKNAHP
ncbi:beta-galactosidase domain 4-containing protein [Puia dinghuensis]|uniref:beta-galactosidase n=1 Tax=Puia dinghuensis TaxID=1792502 RepID=A0A8J2XS71_9BACT|nr:beta-galactosidase domain 4-containing protein [Puia dinghuensis]GGA89800.1 hypothetical protein GCM10011511_11290 [Puia dinghuensis]